MFGKCYYLLILFLYCSLGINQEQNTGTIALSWHNHPYVVKSISQESVTVEKFVNTAFWKILVSPS